MKLYDFKSGDDKLQPLGQIPVLINKIVGMQMSLLVYALSTGVFILQHQN